MSTLPFNTNSFTIAYGNPVLIYQTSLMCQHGVSVRKRASCVKIVNLFQVGHGNVDMKAVTELVKLLNNKSIKMRFWTLLVE